MDIEERLQELAELIASAKPRAFGEGAIIDREAAMRIVEELQTALPAEVLSAKQVVDQADQIRANASEEAEGIIEHARLRSAELVSETEVVMAAHAAAQQIVAAANEVAASKQAEVHAYVESKLASFEGLLSSTLQAVSHGRAKLANDTVDLSHPQVNA